MKSKNNKYKQKITVIYDGRKYKDKGGYYNKKEHNKKSLEENNKKE